MKLRSTKPRILGPDRRGDPTISRKFGGILIVGLLSLVGASAMSGSSRDVQTQGTGLHRPEAQSLLLARIEGMVTDRQTGLPVSGAHAAAPGLNLEATTDPQGRFVWEAIPLTGRVLPVQVTVDAPGYGPWTIRDVRLVADDTLILKASLATEPQQIIVPPPRLREGQARLLNNLPGRPTQGNGIHTGQTLPESIRVRISGSPYTCNPFRSYTLTTVPFRDYVRHVLPNEWHMVENGLGFWESMRAGAVAVKMYAWYWIAQGGKWEDADVWDSTCDQVYNPAVEYASANAVIDYTWNWLLTRDNQLLETNYRTYHYQCPNPDSCLGQVDADQMAANGATWDEILHFFYQGTELSPIIPPPAAGWMLRFFGNGYGLYDRVRIPVDNPGDANPGPPVDVGAGDFTIELWLKAMPAENTAPPQLCGPNQNWMYGNVFLDRDRQGQDRHYGFSLAGGRPILGVTGVDTGSGAAHLTLCGTSIVADGLWHHLAFQRRRSDGFVWLFVDGVPEAAADGPDGDISYPDAAAPIAASDPYLVLGAGKRDANPAIHPPFRGWLDEIRFSAGLRYTGPFLPPDGPLAADPQTLALYRLDDARGDLVSDSAGSAGGPSHGLRRYGGAVNGPDWVFSDLFYNHQTYIPFYLR